MQLMEDVGGQGGSKGGSRLTRGLSKGDTKPVIFQGVGREGRFLSSLEKVGRKKRS